MLNSCFAETILIAQHCTMRPGEGMPAGKTRQRAGVREQAKRRNVELAADRQRAFNMAEMSLTIVHRAQQ